MSFDSHILQSISFVKIITNNQLLLKELIKKIVKIIRRELLKYWHTRQAGTSISMITSKYDETFFSER